MFDTDAVLDALGDRTRRRIFARLKQRALYAGELAEGMEVTRPAVSQHLKVLRDAGLVRVTGEGTRRLYRVEPAGLQAVRDWLDGFWDQALDAYREAAERAARQQESEE